MTGTLIRESTTLAGPAAGGNMLIQLITPGVGSSGVYTPQVLQAAAESKVFPAGTLMFSDHPGETENYDRPERSIRDVAGVLTEDARWDGTALVAEAKTYSPWTQVLTEMHDAIGVSIRAQATLGEADESGRRVVESLDQGISVDFVTQAGRGGRVREVYESARRTSPLIVRETQPVTEATADQRREELADLLKARYGAGNNLFVYVVDHDDTTVWFEIDTGPDQGTWQQAYATTGENATSLTGTPTQVRRVTTFVPVTPAGQPHTTESEEDTMPQIEESRLAQLEEADRRVPVLETERDTLITERDTARQSVSEAHQEADRAHAARIIAESGHQFTALERRGLLVDPPTGESGRLDQEAFAAAVAEAAAEAQEARGAGAPRGLGDTNPHGSGEDLTEADLDAALAALTGRTIKEA
jgi:hypothetical protein